MASRAAGLSAVNTTLAWSPSVVIAMCRRPQLSRVQLQVGLLRATSRARVGSQVQEQLTGKFGHCRGHCTEPGAALPERVGRRRCPQLRAGRSRPCMSPVTWEPAAWPSPVWARAPLGVWPATPLPPLADAPTRRHLGRQPGVRDRLSPCGACAAAPKGVEAAACAGKLAGGGGPGTGLPGLLPSIASDASAASDGSTGDARPCSARITCSGLAAVAAISATASGGGLSAPLLVAPELRAKRSPQQQ